MRLNESVAFVTGGNRGIGRALVNELLIRGAKRVYVGYRGRSNEAEDANPTRVVPVRIDVTNDDDIVGAAAHARDVTLLVNNAGVLDFGNILDAEPAALRRNMDVNYYGTLAVTRAFVPVLERNRGGAIINVLTLVALASMPGLGIYNASKAAAWSMTQSIRADLVKRGIAVFSVFPGAVDTDMLRGVDMPKTSPEDVARLVFDGVERGDEDVFPDPMSQQLYANWCDDHKSVERQFATM